MSLSQVGLKVKRANVPIARSLASSDGCRLLLKGRAALIPLGAALMINFLSFVAFIF